MVGLLGAVAVVLLLVVVFMIARTSELASLLKDKTYSYERASNVNGWMFLIFLFLMFGGMIYSSIKFVPLMLPKAASIHGIQTDSVTATTVFFTVLVFAITHVLLFWFAFRYRERKEQKAYFFPHSNTLELIWTSVPAVVMTVLVVMGLKTWYGIFNAPDEWAANEEKPLVIEVTAKQFGWIIRYAGEDGEFGERIIDKEHISGTNELGVDFDQTKSHDDIYANEIFLIKDRPTIVKLGALDVLHSFYLPHFRVKMDCVPGIPTSFPFVPNMTTDEYKDYLKNSGNPYWAQIDPETGEPRWMNFHYELACTELCGRSHFAMQKNVVVGTEEEFKEWLTAQTPYYEQVIAPAMGIEIPKEEVIEEAVPVEEPVEETPVEEAVADEVATL